MREAAAIARGESCAPPSRRRSSPRRLIISLALLVFCTPAFAGLLPGAVKGEEYNEAVELLAVQIAERRAKLEIAPDPPVVSGDPVRLLQVFQNLLSNALKFMGDETSPRIEVGARRAGVEVICTVRDNGIGIDAEYHEKIFGVFDQLNPNEEGTGIGLATVQRIVQAHGGRVWVESEGVGKGSMFCFTLPQRDAEVNQEKVIAPS